MLEKFYIGTYTHKTSQGVYSVELNPEAGRLQNTQFVAAAGSPTYLAQSKDNILYAVDKETTDHETTGGLLVYDLNRTPAVKVQSTLDKGSSPAYVGVDNDRDLVFTANYHTGAVSVYQIAADGTLQLAHRVFDEGEVGPKPEQQDGPHPHYADLTPERRLVVCDLGLDLVYIYDVLNEGQLTEVSRLQMPAGFGPRHISFDPVKNVAYLVGELSSNVATLNYDQVAGVLSIRQITHTIPSDWPTHNGAAAIRLTRDGEFLYVSNRGHNSIAVFKTHRHGELELVQLISTEGDFPRDFNFNGDQTYLIAANQNTDNLTLYKRDPETGKLTMLQKDYEVPEGVSVLRSDADD
ncbi:lactonase family protein [Levilactobacillus bambusae]|uniref:6-phosphogluconolactonase n=1 Tax=Levilactobacillus bambusae TaxID=2024736 RepID=A0A2V1N023_9LACO|nr:lactonase family protein [Levilactobacillus bambusae]PWG00098.1 6-phosphogluconolactonase [Levilactobacillus bambusae]